MKSGRLGFVFVVAHAAVAVLGVGAPGFGKFDYRRDAAVMSKAVAYDRDPSPKHQTSPPSELRQSVAENFMSGKQQELDKMKKDGSDMFLNLLRDLNGEDPDAAEKFDQLATICAPSPSPKYDKPPRDSDVEKCLSQTKAEFGKLRDSVVQSANRCSKEKRRQAATGIGQKMDALTREHQRRTEDLKKSAGVMIKCDADDCMRVEMSTVRMHLLQFEQARDQLLQNALESAKAGFVALNSCVAAFYDKFLTVSDYYEKTFRYCELYPMGKIKSEKGSRDLSPLLTRGIVQ